MNNWRKIEIDLKDHVEINEYGELRKIVDDTITLYSIGVNSRGYMTIRLYDTNNKRKNFTIHKLVALTFLNTKINECVNHKDGDKLNNHFSNLEWVTRKQNCQHAKTIDHLRRLDTFTDKDIITLINEYLTGEMILIELAQKWNISRETLRSIINRRAKSILSNDEYRALRDKYISVKESRKNKRLKYGKGN